MEVEANTSGQTQAKTKFCKHCGGTIPQDAVMCTHCGRQVEELAGAAKPQVVIQNTNMNTNTADRKSTRLNSSHPSSSRMPSSA